jgi:DNA-binding response OmpR family regulator
MAQQGTSDHGGDDHRDRAPGAAIAESSAEADGRHDVAGFRYRAALTGSAALAEVRRQPPQVIVLDLMLPDIDGLEICRRVRKEFSEGNVPVIILTALESEQTRRSGIECGASEYLTKPFDPELLMSTIARYATKR